MLHKAVVVDASSVLPATLLLSQVWGGVMPLSFFPAYCGIVLLASAAVQKFFVVSAAGQTGLSLAL